MNKALLAPCLLFILALCVLPSQAQYKAGDSLQFWSPTYIDWPGLQHVPQRQMTAICKKAGDHCYVFVEKGIEQPDQSDIDDLVSEFDNKYYDSLTFRYGPVPDELDHDPRVFILVMEEPEWGGYYDPGQQMPDSLVQKLWNKRSNERELIYVSQSSFSGAEEVVSHEFGHLLHWQQDHSPEPAINPVRYWEMAWVDEGFSTFAALFLTQNIFQKDVMDYSAYFVSNPDISLTYFTNYDQAELFMLFMFEHYGGWDYIHTLLRNQADGTQGVESTLKQLGYSQTFNDVFEQFIVANCIDDPTFAQGKYAHHHYNFDPCRMSMAFSSLPAQKVEARVRAYAADYISFTPSASSKPFIIDFQGQAAVKYRIGFILINTSGNKVIDYMSLTPDSENKAEFFAQGFGTDYNKVIMVVMNIDETVSDKVTTGYSYSVQKLKKVKKSH